MPWCKCGSRVCAICGANCKGKKVAEQDTKLHIVICLACGPNWTIGADGYTTRRQKREAKRESGRQG